MQDRRASSVFLGASERRRVSRETQDQLEDLRGRQERVTQGVDALREQLQQWVQSVEEQVDAATSQASLAHKEITAQLEMKQSELVSAQPEAGKEDGEGLYVLKLAVPETKKHSSTTDTDC